MQSSLPPTILDIPVKVETSSSARNAIVNIATPVQAVEGDEVVRAVLKYHNEEGRKAIVSAAKTIHHDFGPFNASLSVSLLEVELDKLKSNVNVEWFEGDGKVDAKAIPCYVKWYLNATQWHGH
eukprot:scaffold31832_cov62-Cyclotella_meneghiniana.AAC.4